MEITLQRNKPDDKCTTGELFINGVHECYMLEDVDRGLDSSMTLDGLRQLKVYGETAIPTGRYQVTKSYWTKHSRFTPYLNFVPAFDGIRMHSGVTANDTEGCPLYAESLITDATQNTTTARINADKKIFDALDNMEEVWITIKRPNNA